MIPTYHILLCLCGFILFCFLAWWWRLLNCPHPANSRQWPVNGVERCFNCMRVRLYAWDSETRTYDLGNLGRWHK